MMPGISVTIDLHGCVVFDAVQNYNFYVKYTAGVPQIIGLLSTPKMLHHVSALGYGPVISTQDI